MTLSENPSHRKNLRVLPSEHCLCPIVKPDLKWFHTTNSMPVDLIFYALISIAKTERNISYKYYQNQKQGHTEAIMGYLIHMHIHINLKKYEPKPVLKSIEWPKRKWNLLSPSLTSSQQTTIVYTLFKNITFDCECYLKNVISVNRIWTWHHSAKHSSKQL